ncbi:hypothetical protein EYC80_003014 [Monilinia laxa]|uniref:Uncharacterized protein n=1 Tax=Monilinia laxa TaxID=61186 RepID=A0A5N6KCG6_MONLA|nr:hypothetical protein EYC80_003014 [Monilinia laxa]
MRFCMIGFGGEPTSRHEGKMIPPTYLRRGFHLRISCTESFHSRGLGVLINFMNEDTGWLGLEGLLASMVQGQHTTVIETSQLRFVYEMMALPVVVYWFTG